MATSRSAGGAQGALGAASSITLEGLVAATSGSVLRALQEHERLDPRIINPRIWVGIWIDLEKVKQLGGPAGPG